MGKRERGLLETKVLAGGSPTSVQHLVRALVSFHGFSWCFRRVKSLRSLTLLAAYVVVKIIAPFRCVVAIELPGTNLLRVVNGSQDHLTTDISKSFRPLKADGVGLSRITFMARLALCGSQRSTSKN
jgi:hypothetical protein